MLLLQTELEPSCLQAVTSMKYVIMDPYAWRNLTTHKNLRDWWGGLYLSLKMVQPGSERMSTVPDSQTKNK